MKLKSITLIITILFGSMIYAQNIDIQKIDKFINHIENNNRGIGSVSIFKDGKEVYNRSFGQKNLKNVTYNAETKYQIGSITKMITATLVFKLIEENKLHLDDKLAMFFPKIPNANKITIKNLLEHSSGLGDYAVKGNDLKWLMKKVSKKEIFDEIIKQGTFFEPNSNIKYSNSGYFLLAQIVEKLFQKEYAEIVKNEIAKPLNLKNFESTTDKTTNVFQSFSYNGQWQKIEEFYFPNALGAGDISSTTKDLNIFLYNLFQYKILKKESIEQMLPNASKKEMFGRGFMLIPFYENIYYGHGGDTFGTHSMVAYNEKDHFGISYAINGERFPHNDFAIGILSVICGKDYKFPDFKTVAVKTEDLDKFVGVYSSPQLPIKLTITKEGKNLITKEGKNLKAQGTGQPAFPLECYELNKFKCDAIRLKLEFKPQENKMILHQGGMEFEMTKE